jgi:hypothetical protein
MPAGGAEYCNRCQQAHQRKDEPTPCAACPNNPGEVLPENTDAWDAWRLVCGMWDPWGGAFDQARAAEYLARLDMADPEILLKVQVMAEEAARHRRQRSND